MQGMRRPAASLLDVWSIPLPTSSAFCPLLLRAAGCSASHHATPRHHLLWSVRGPRLLQELAAYQADVVCLQVGACLWTHSGQGRGRGGVSFVVWDATGDLSFLLLPLAVGSHMRHLQSREPAR